MKQEDEAEFKVNTVNMYRHGGVPNVLDCLISMLEVQLIIVKKLKEILNRPS